MKSARSVDLLDCYRVLNLGRDVCWLEVKRAYHELAKQYHPDRNPGDRQSEDRFKKISRAFEILQQRHRKQESAANSSPIVPTLPEEEAVTDNDSPGPDKMEEPSVKESSYPIALGNWSARLLESLRQCERRWLMLDVIKTIWVDPATAARGGTIKIRTAQESFFVTIPPNTPHGFFLRIPERGETGLLNRKRGDLVLKIQLPLARSRRKATYYHHVRISREDLEKGGVQTLQTKHGPLKYTLPRSTTSGQQFALKSPPDAQHPEGACHIVIVGLE